MAELRALIDGKRGPTQNLSPSSPSTPAFANGRTIYPASKLHSTPSRFDLERTSDWATNRSWAARLCDGRSKPTTLAPLAHAAAKSPVSPPKSKAAQAASSTGKTTKKKAKHGATADAQTSNDAPSPPKKSSKSKDSPPKKPRVAKPAAATPSAVAPSAAPSAGSRPSAKALPTDKSERRASELASTIERVIADTANASLNSTLRLSRPQLAPMPATGASKTDRPKVKTRAKSPSSKRVPSSKRSAVSGRADSGSVTSDRVDAIAAAAAAAEQQPPNNAPAAAAAAFPVKQVVGGARPLLSSLLSSDSGAPDPGLRPASDPLGLRPLSPLSAVTSGAAALMPPALSPEPQLPQHAAQRTAQVASAAGASVSTSAESVSASASASALRSVGSASGAGPPAFVLPQPPPPGHATPLRSSLSRQISDPALAAFFGSDSLRGSRRNLRVSFGSSQTFEYEVRPPLSPHQAHAQPDLSKFYATDEEEEELNF